MIKQTFLKTVLNIAVATLIFAILFLFTNCLYFVDNATKVAGLTLKDFSLICVGIIFLLALIFNRLSLKELFKTTYFLIPLVFIPLLCLISSIVGKYTFEQSVWTGLRPQRFFILYPFAYFGLSTLVKNKLVSLKAIVIAVVAFALVECTLGFVQYFLKDKIFFLIVNHTSDRGYRIIMASSPVFLGVSVLIGQFAKELSQKKYFKTVLCGLALVYLTLFDLIITKYRIYIICFAIGFIACLLFLFSKKKPDAFRKVYPFLLGLIGAAVVGGIAYVLVVLLNEGSVNTRMNGYYNYLSLFVHYPFTGIGFPSELNSWSKVIARMSNNINYVDIGLVGFIGLYGFLGFIYYCLFFYVSALFIKKSKLKCPYILIFTIAFYIASSLTVIPYFCDQNIIVTSLILVIIESENYFASKAGRALLEKSDTSKKIIMIGPKCIPSRLGGIDVVVNNLSNELVNKGNKVTIYTRRKSDQEVSNSNLKIKKIFTLKTKSLEAVVYSFFATIKALLSDADVIHFHAEGSCLFLWMTRFSKKRIVATIHGLDWKRDKFKGFGTKVLLKSEKRTVKYADEIIVLSKSDQNYFKEKYNRETICVPNGIEPQKIINPNLIKTKYGLEKGSYFLFLARIVPEKGLHYLINAYNKHPYEHKLVIVGGESHSKPYFDEMEELAASNENIIFTGFVQGEELDELYSNCHLFVLPSDIEGMAMSLIEAISHERVCLVSDIAENKICRENLYFFKKSSIESLEEMLTKLDKEELSFKQGKYFLSWEEVASKTLEVYK